MAGDGLCQEAESIALLLTTGLSNGQQACSSNRASLASISEAGLSPLHCGTQRLFGAIIGRLDAFFLEEAKEPVGVLAEEICHVGNFTKLAIPPFFR